MSSMQQSFVYKRQRVKGEIEIRCLRCKNISKIELKES